MLDDEILQTRKTNRQQSTPDLMIMQKPNDEDSNNVNHADTTAINAIDEEFKSNPCTPEPTPMVVNNSANLSYHHAAIDDRSFSCTERTCDTDSNNSNGSNSTSRKILPTTTIFAAPRFARRQSAPAISFEPKASPMTERHLRNRKAFFSAVRTAWLLQQRTTSRGGIAKRYKRGFYNSRTLCRSALPTWITAKLRTQNNKPVLVVKQRGHYLHHLRHQRYHEQHSFQFQFTDKERMSLNSYPSHQHQRQHQLLHLHQRHHHFIQDTLDKIKLTYPPITADALSELSIPQLFNSLQIRHDLLIDPNLTFRPNLTDDKRQEADMYWRQFDQLIKRIFLFSPDSITITPDATMYNSDDFYQLVYLIRNIVTELALILISLIAPFPTHPDIIHFVWHWPQDITESSILSVFDPDLIQQQLLRGCFDIDSKFEFLYRILSPLCPDYADKIHKKAIEEKEYGKAVELVFLTLETIKLDCANKALQHYRPYLLDTGTSLELKLFLTQMEQGEVDTTSVVDWLAGSWRALEKDAPFVKIFYTGVLDLLTNDSDTCHALNIPLPTFPITFSYDEKRFKQQLRHEFQNTIVIGILLMPYRLLAGKKATSRDLHKLKTCFSKLLKDASLSNGRVSCFHLALQGCLMAKQSLGHDEDVTEQAKYWSNWINQNLKNTSDIYRIMYQRIRSVLLKGLLQHSFSASASNNNEHATMGLEAEITKLGQKLLLMTDYNLRTFYPIYSHLVSTVCHKLNEGTI
ncbi:T-complex protein 11-domain-containing protein [Mycotypha africana]|uniref:T-complex protein 11-domain-containing protein n=1 Tax=Mycotypha africana TaxID=64632 RepID=UPI002301AB0B|nr:T-complex protein 11-domain-containing protein [Mycotypha africana]KAI8968574.1 T-complex protein 11-domain-containing protein [Mycotypha africana]